MINANNSGVYIIMHNGMGTPFLKMLRAFIWYDGMLAMCVHTNNTGVHLNTSSNIHVHICVCMCVCVCACGMCMRVCMQYVHACMCVVCDVWLLAPLDTVHTQHTRNKACSSASVS